MTKMRVVGSDGTHKNVELVPAWKSSSRSVRPKARRDLWLLIGMLIVVLLAIAGLGAFLEWLASVS